MEWMLMPYKRYADFSGRSRRKEYWMFMVFFLIVYAICFALIAAGGGFGTYDPATGTAGGPGGLGMVGIGLLLIFVLGSFIPALAVQVRRFHDQDKSGWFVLLSLIPYVGGLVVLVFMCLEGTRGPNRFGADPKDPAGAQVFS